MVKSGNQPLENAEEIIERFGGIRPMASKIDVAVTTIQGWKKRGVIPANRKSNIISSAQENNIDLSGLIEGLAPPANESTSDVEEAQVIQFQEQESEEMADAETEVDSEFEFDREPEPEPEPEPLDLDSDLEGNEEEASYKEEDSKEDVKEEVVETAEEKPSYTELNLSSRSHTEDRNTENFAQLAIETEKRAVTKSAVVTFAVVLGAIVMILMPKIEQVDHQDQRITSLEGEVNKVKEDQSSFKGLVPRDWSKQLDDLKKQVAQAGQAVAPAIKSAQKVSGDFIEGNTGAIQERVNELESYVSEMKKSTSVSGFMERISEMANNVMGQQVLDQSVLDLNSIYAAFGANNISGEQINAYLDQARSQSASLGQTFENVPQNDLQAAAMLLAMTQMRSSLNRESKPFDDDLGLLMNMVSDDNIELRTSLEKLAPHAKEGILTPDGLSNEFRSLAGDVIESSLKGEDVSLLEKAQARMNNLLAIEKDGELITGTDTQAVVSKAQKQIEQGNVEGALDVLKSSLTANELAPLKEWIGKAEGFIGSREAISIIEDMINMNSGSGYLGGANLLGKDRVDRYKH
ncbi:MAG: hypothetical protein OEY94_05710 [Alphaproteobacteria bacterium]|nr:hypothetical protein [Alphaproteobacteria bacterium]